MDDFLTKPIERTRLEEALLRVLRTPTSWSAPATVRSGPKVAL
jgi:FixJ family two-component response regulator